MAEAVAAGLDHTPTGMAEPRVNADQSNDVLLCMIIGFKRSIFRARRQRHRS
jgi:hypothetical protein